MTFYSINNLYEFMNEKAKNAINSRGVFNIAVSGGSMPRLTQKAMEGNEKWNVFFVDERVVPLIDNQSNYKAWRQWIIETKAIAHKIEFSSNADNVREDYELKVKKNVPNLVFDLIMLGMGEDGHTASLFPSLKHYKDDHLGILLVDDSPKPPSVRITFSLPLITRSRSVIFIACGEGKRNMIKNGVENTFVGKIVREADWFHD